MSLTSLLKQPEVRAKFSAEFKKPTIALGSTVYSAATNPSASHAALVGTAFDYAFRLHVGLMNSNVWEGEWVAEEAVEHLKSKLSLQSQIFPPGSTRSTRGLCTNAQRVIRNAHAAQTRCINRGTISDKALEHTVALAQLEQFFRCGILSESFGTPNEDIVIDLKSLLEVARQSDTEMFSASRVCVLNPSFRKASFLVNGADADLLIDDTLIDIKTTKHLTFTAEIFRQLMGYYTLYRIGGGINRGVKPKPRINNVAVYFARYGVFASIAIENVLNQQTFPTFTNWFKKYVEIA